MFVPLECTEQPLIDVLIKPDMPTCHWSHSYSGPTAAFAYMNLDAAHVRRIFILGPSHHVYLKYAPSTAIVNRRTASSLYVCVTPV